jgi:putative ABC transport system ATP-binding protein
MERAVQLEDVSCRFAGRGAGVTALDRVDLDVMRGSFVAVMGATGSGKSTLLNCAAALDRPSSGVVRLLGHDVTTMKEPAVARLRRDHVGFVFQSYNLLSELTVAQNVLMPCRLGARQARSLAEVLDSVGLGGAQDRAVGELSGGQRQRVAIARALVTAPPVIFADEPTGALDPSTGAQILSLLRRAVDELGTTVMMVTHDPPAAAFSDRLVLLRTGRIVEDRPTPDASSIAEQLQHVSSPTLGGLR